MNEIGERNVVLYLSNQKGASVLRYLLGSPFACQVAEVITAPYTGTSDDSHTDILKMCNRDKVPCRLRTESPEGASTGKYAIAVGWRWMIESDAEIIVLHDSILPRYRGWSPLVNMLINGEHEIGVTALHATDEVDAGDIIYQRSRSISYPITIAEAIQLVIPLYLDTVGKIMEDISEGRSLPREPQNHANATYSLWRDEEDYRLDWLCSATQLCRCVDALGPPFAGARAVYKGKAVTIDRATPLPDVVFENRVPGKIFRLDDGRPVVVCGKGLLRIDRCTDGDGNVIAFKSLRSRFT